MINEIKKAAIKEMKTLELLDRLEHEQDDDLWMGCWEELMERSPFQGITELIDDSETRIDDLEKQIRELRELLRTHVHMGNKLVFRKSF